MARAHRITADKAREARWAKHHADPQRWFWTRVAVGPDDECWPWTGRTMSGRGGYGRLKFQGRELGAHRMALVIATGQNPDGLQACHKCDNPICVNPGHLFWGTPAENTRDCLAKGRRRAPHPRKIDLRELVELRASGLKYAELAARYGVNQASIGKALLRARAEGGE